MIGISVDVTKIDKARIKEFKRRDGTIGKSLELILIECSSEYGDYMVKQSITKEERESKKEMPILGNGRILGGSRPARTEQPKPKAGSEKPKREDPFD